MTLEVAGVEITKPDKELVAATADAAAVTKRDLAEYYRSVADLMLPHLKDRPISMERYPDGLEGASFYEKKVPSYVPDFVATAAVATADGPQDQVVVNGVRTLVYLAQQACLTPHTWLARVGDLDRPDQLIVDLDPSVDDLARVRRATRAVGELLDELGLTSYLKTTGSRGYHVLVPLRRAKGFDDVRAFAHRLAAVLVDRHPELLTSEARKNKRGDRVLVDIQRNAYAQTVVPPYAVRARPGAPVATPIGWDELARVRPDQFTVRSIARRLGRTGDPWATGLRRQGLAAASRRLERLR